MMCDRCEWVKNDPLYIVYHDDEWGVPVHSDRRLFEFLILGGAQAGLSWSTILRKRENYRQAFDGFDPKIIAQYDHTKIEELLQNQGIIRNRLKIQATVINARMVLHVLEEFDSFDQYIWQFVNGEPIQNHWESIQEIPTKTQESDLMSKDLKKRGFKFVGSIICYAFMQAVGMVNDHTIHCFRHHEISSMEWENWHD
jgi:DNA-3-methyladenine glycosylase I